MGVVSCPAVDLESPLKVHEVCLLIRLEKCRHPRPRAHFNLALRDARYKFNVFGDQSIFTRRASDGEPGSRGPVSDSRYPEAFPNRLNADMQRAASRSKSVAHQKHLFIITKKEIVGDSVTVCIMRTHVVDHVTRTVGVGIVELHHRLHGAAGQRS